jgi:carboxyl-terminal processing protease
MNNSRLLGYMLPFVLAVGLTIGLYTGKKIGSPTYNAINLGGGGRMEEMIHFIEENYVDTVDKEKLMQTALTEMLQSLDPHSDFIPKEYYMLGHEQLEAQFVGIGVRFLIHRDTLRVTHIIPGGPSERAGLNPGDKIVAVNDENIASVGLQNQDVLKKLKGPEGSEVLLQVIRGKEKRKVPIARGPVVVSSLSSSYMVSKEIGYIKLDRFARISALEFKEALQTLREKGMTKLLFDLRSNGGGYMDVALEILDEFFEDRVLLMYTEDRTKEPYKYFSEGGGSFADNKVVVLINESSASASEIVSGAIQDNDRGIIVGRRSFGKGLVQNEIPLSDSSAFRLTVARYYIPSGRSIQKPYGKNVDYEMEVYHRYESGELYNEDSIKVADSLKFFTKKGRVVYGGGGIMPDVFVPQDTSEKTSAYIRDLYYNQVFTHYAYEYADKHRELVKNKSYFIRSFKVDETMIQELGKMGEELFNLSLNSEDLIKYQRQLAKTIKANIADQLWSASEYYEVRNPDDDDYIEALKQIKKL